MFTKTGKILVCSLLISFMGMGLLPGKEPPGEIAPGQPGPPVGPEELFPRRLPVEEAHLTTPEAVGPDLPGECSSLAPPGGSAPPYCIFGYVYLDGSPVAGASVEVADASGILVTTTTASGPESSEPYFAAGLDGNLYDVRAGDVLEVRASASGENSLTTFVLVDNAQQVDVWLSTTCGPTNISGGVIAANGTWRRECSPYIVQANTLVGGGIKLTIEPGVVVKFAADKALDVEGELDAVGAANAMIRFTSNTTETPGAWAHLLFSLPPEAAQTSSEAPEQISQIAYALVEYAGGTLVSDNAAIRVDGTGLSVDTTVVRDSASDGLRVINLGLLYIEDSLVCDNAGWGVYVYSSMPDVYVIDSTIVYNAGGGVYIRNSPNAWVRGNYVRNPGGRGVEVRGSNTVASVAFNTITDHDESNGAGVLAYDGVISIDHNWIYGNRATTYGGGLYLYSPSIVSDNLILDNTASGKGGGIYIFSSRPHVNLNVIAENQAPLGAGVYLLTTSSTTMAQNSILYNTSTGQGAGAYIHDPDVDFFYNTLYQNVPGEGMGSVYVDNLPWLHHNNLPPYVEYALYNGNAEGSGALIAEDNWWGSQFLEVIALFVWDWYDDTNLGVVDYNPPLANWVLSAPVSPPRNLTASVVNDAIQLAWGSNPESDVIGYRVYYDNDQPGFPYLGSGAVQGNSPIDVGDAHSLDLTGLPPGFYHVGVTAYDNGADGVYDWFEGHESWFTQNQTVLIGEAPQAIFAGAPTSGPPPLAVQFTDASSGDFVTWEWDFGDGTTSSLQHPAHLYTQEGTYTVTLSVDGPTGSDTLVRPGYIQTYAPPSADFSATPTGGSAPLEVTFTDISSGTIASWAWEFGDGGSSETQHPTYVYEAAGVYTVTLSVSGPGGSDSELKQAYIHAGAGSIVADFSAAPTSGDFPLEVQFQDQSSGDINTWMWDFGDGSTSSASNPKHTYQKPGLYDISLTVSGPDGSDTLNRPGYIQVFAAHCLYLPLICP